MGKPDRDTGAEMLLDLDGQVFVVDTKGQYWVRFNPPGTFCPRSAAWTELLVNAARPGWQTPGWI
jgi:hypothetical protein